VQSDISWLWGLFAAALGVGFLAQLWFIAGFMRARTDV
jgi:hypothetical protein